MRKELCGKRTSFLMIYFFMFFIFSVLNLVEAREELRVFHLLDDVDFRIKKKNEKTKTKTLPPLKVIEDTGAFIVKSSHVISFPSEDDPACTTNYLISRDYNPKLASHFFIQTFIAPEQEKIKGKIVLIVTAKIQRDDQWIGDDEGCSFFLGKIKFSAKKANKIRNNYNKNVREYMAHMKLPSELFKKGDLVKLLIERTNAHESSNYAGIVYLKQTTVIYNERKESKVAASGFDPACSHLNTSVVCGCGINLCNDNACCPN